MEDVLGHLYCVVYFCYVGQRLCVNTLTNKCLLSMLKKKLKSDYQLKQALCVCMLSQLAVAQAQHKL